MNLDKLPPEMLDLIAYQVLLSERGEKEASVRGLCYYTDDEDPNHHKINFGTSSPFPAGSSVSSLASVSQYIRNVLFVSRDPRFIKVMYERGASDKAERIRPGLLARVSKLRLISRKTSVNSDNTAIISKSRGIGDILQPYYALQHLEIDWHLLDKEDPRLQAMQNSANAIPVMKFDLRCSRACTLSTVGDLHIRLGSGSTLMDTAKSEMMAEQFDLILQQFDMPALRNLHLSHDFKRGDLDMLHDQWNKLLPSIRLQYWPYLESIHICIAALYRFSSDDGELERLDKPIWRPIVNEIVNHVSSCKKPIKVNITLLWRFRGQPHPDPFKVDDDGKTTLREEIMPIPKSIKEFVKGLEGRAKSRPFSLEIRATCGSNVIDYKRLLTVDYQPDLVGDQGTSSTPTPDDPALRYELCQDNIDYIRNAVSQPRTPPNRDAHFHRGVRARIRLVWEQPLPDRERWFMVQNQILNHDNEEPESGGEGSHQGQEVETESDEDRGEEGDNADENGGIGYRMHAGSNGGSGSASEEDGEK